MKIEKTVAMILLTQQLGIKTHLTFTFGLPGETHETIEKTIQLALKISPTSLQFSIATPFPGTRLHKELKEKGQLIAFDSKDLDGHHAAVITTHALVPSDLIAAKQKAYTLWKQHLLKQRSPEPIRLGLWHLKRARSVFKESGFLGTCSKIKDYLRFSTHYNHDIRQGKKHMLNGGPLRVARIQENICFFYKNNELTRGPGLHSSFVVQEKRYDTTLCNCQISKTDIDTLWLKMDLSGQGLTDACQIWRLKLKDDKLQLLVQFQTPQPVTLLHFKISLSLVDAFDAFHNEHSRLQLSPIEDWFTHPITGSGHRALIYASQQGYPAIQFDLFANALPFQEEIQNSSRMISARMLHAHCDEITLLPGRHNIFQGSFTFSESADNVPVSR